MNAELIERGGPVDGKGGSRVDVNVSKLDMSLNIPEKLVKDAKERELSPEMRRALTNVGFLDLKMLIDARGDVSQATASARGAPADIHREVESLGDDILNSLNAVAIQLPNRTVSHLETWTAKRPMSILGVAGDIKVNMDVTYTYLGHRNRNGREEALVEISGRMRKKDMGIRLGGRVEGRALVDLESGVVTMAHARAIMDLDLPFREFKTTAQGTLDVHLTRELPR
jgi:hypothetical protein